METDMESATFKKMTEEVEKFHKKHKFKENGAEDMYYRMNIVMEEIGEICECLSKGKSIEELAEEHADVLILLIGNAIACDFPLEDAFWKKLKKLMK